MLSDIAEDGTWLKRCGMSRATTLLLGGRTPMKRAFSGPLEYTLTADNVNECLQLTIGRSKAPSQEFVTRWRTTEFLYLLSLWICKFTTMIVGSKGLKGSCFRGGGPKTLYKRVHTCKSLSARFSSDPVRVF